MKIAIILIIALCLVSYVSADIISINSGGTNNLVITPGGWIENFFTGLLGISSAGGDGGAGREATPLVTVQIATDYEKIVQNNPVSFEIIITNNALPRHTAEITYYLTNGISNYSKTSELIKEIPIGTYSINRSIYLPPNSTLGKWEIILDYVTTDIEPITAKSEFEVVKNPIQNITPSLIFFIIMFIFLGIYIYWNKKKKNKG